MVTIPGIAFSNYGINLKASFCRLFFWRACGEFEHINAFPSKWWKVCDKNLEQCQLTIFVKYRIGNISNCG